MKSVFKMSTPKKLNISSIFLSRGNRYLAGDLTSWLESVAMMDYCYNLGVLDLEESEKRIFLKRRGLYTREDMSLVKSKGSYYDGTQGLFYVLSSEKALNEEKDPYRRLKLWEFLAPPKFAKGFGGFTEKERLASARNFNVDCPCPRADFQNTCRAPEVWREFYKDFRSSYSRPSPANDSVLDRHGFIGVQHGVIFHGFDGLGVFDFPPKAMAVMADAIRKQIRNRDRIDNYLFNPILAETEMITPWADLIKFAYNLNLYEILPRLEIA